MKIKRRSFLKFLAVVVITPLSVLDTAAAPIITKTMELEGALADYIGFPAHGGYIYCPYIPKTVRDGKWKTETKPWGKITGWTTIEDHL
jgi:hypothetical protein